MSSDESNKPLRENHLVSCDGECKICSPGNTSVIEDQVGHLPPAGATHSASYRIVIFRSTFLASWLEHAGETQANELSFCKLRGRISTMNMPIREFRRSSTLRL